MGERRAVASDGKGEEGDVSDRGLLNGKGEENTEVVRSADERLEGETRPICASFYLGVFYAGVQTPLEGRVLT